MKILSLVLFLATTPAFAGHLTCGYSYFRNSISLKKQITPVTAALPRQSIPCDGPRDGQIRGRLAIEDFELDGHKLSFMALLVGRPGDLKMSISDKTDDSHYAHAVVKNASSSQVASVQYNFRNGDVVTGVIQTCSLTP
jgi:hypothetical protein